MMKTREMLTALALGLIVAGGMGSDCSTTEPPAGDCISEGTCEPNKYADTSLGDYDSTSYRLMGLRPAAGGTPAAGTKDGEILKVNGFANGTAISYWLLSEVDSGMGLVDVFSGTEAFFNRIYRFYDAAGAEVGDPVVNITADSTDYSPLWQVFKVMVPTGYVADTLKSVASINTAAGDPATGISVVETTDVVVFEIADKTVTLQGATANSEWPQQMTAWFDSSVVYGFMVPAGNADGSLPVTLVDNAIQPFFSDLWQFRSTTLCFNRNTYGDAYGGGFYSAVPVLHFTKILNGDACTATPTNRDDTIAAIQATDYEVTSDIIIVAPQAP